MVKQACLLLLFLLIIYVCTKYVIGEKTTDQLLRFSFFPIHLWLRDSIFRLTGSNFITGIVWLFVGIFSFLLFIPIYWLNHTFGFVFAYYLFAGYVSSVFPQKHNLTKASKLGKSKYHSYYDLKRKGLITNSGIILGQKRHHIVAKPIDFEGNVAIFGGPGAGKTAGNLIPTLLFYPGNALVVDIKSELLNKTGHQHANKKVLDFVQPGQSYDPLTSIKIYSDATMLSKILIPDSPDKKNYFIEKAQNILASICWDLKEQNSFSEVAKFLTENSIEDVIKYLRNSPRTEKHILNNTTANINSEQLAHISSVLYKSVVDFVTDPVLKQLASRQSGNIRPEDIENNWVYINLPESELKVYRPYLDLFLAQNIDYLSHRPSNMHSNLLLALDDFPKLGYLPFLLDNICTLCSRNVSTMILSQSLAQLDRVYHKSGRKIIMDNMHYIVVHNALDHTTQQYFSDRTILQRYKAPKFPDNTNDRSDKRGGYFSLQRTSRKQRHMPLIQPNKFATLKHSILYTDNLEIVALEKSFWFDDPRMKALVEVDDNYGSSE